MVRILLLSSSIFFGSILGIMGGIISIAAFLGPTLAGLTYDTFGHYRFIWLFFASTFAISVLLMLKVKPYLK